ncbi:MAG TPA: ATP-binding protein, partial [Chitinophagaceae bacterium]|nr:ATP-binding protein [Chitinophagaceae bacterium]
KFPGDDELIYRTATPHLQRLSEIAFTYQMTGVLYANLGDYENALIHHLKGRQFAEESGNILVQAILHMTLGRVYLNLQKPDSALNTVRRAYHLFVQKGYYRYLGSALLNTGRIYFAMGKKDSAMHYYRWALETSREYHYFRGVAASYLAIADMHKEMGHPDSVLFYIRNAVAATSDLDAPDLYLRSYTALANYYRTAGNNDSAVRYQSLIIRIKDSLFNVKQSQEFQNISFDAQQHQLEKEATEKAYRNRLKMYGLLTGLGIFLMLALILWRNNRNKQKAYYLLQKQKQEIDFQRSKAEQALAELRSAQAQLIQSEKMASLGELTAGIAHEIQNPLNFVNNFSEVNNELIEELKNQKSKLKREELDEILNNLFQNNEKINHHGKRADAIVKGMLQHSRTGSEQKEQVDINVLCDEYLRLAYHGMRAKDKSFNVSIKSDLDQTIGLVNIIRQDIGRVILNLITNAFYSVTEKQKQTDGNYKPTVTLSTKKINSLPSDPAGRSSVEISVKDNGTGIPQQVLDKIFQPFFTTKPTGQGTGLGLSLSYDIVKAHGGELKVETKENQHTIFIVSLPVS